MHLRVSSDIRQIATKAAHRRIAPPSCHRDDQRVQGHPRQLRDWSSHCPKRLLQPMAPGWSSWRSHRRGAGAQPRGMGSGGAPRGVEVRWNSLRSAPRPDGRWRVQGGEGGGGGGTEGEGPWGRGANISCRCDISCPSLWTRHGSEHQHWAPPRQKVGAACADDSARLRRSSSMLPRRKCEKPNSRRRKGCRTEKTP